ncbi:MAG: tyrosine--tRNA ligase [Paracoccaceae bacterium]|nr:tyrosine--tRNA ligase [Paracoccaceae bacterium]
MHKDIEIKSEFLRVLSSRGFIHDCTDIKGLDSQQCINKKLIAYVGYDATAQSLHVGHLVNIMMLRWLQKFGGQPITLIGGGTTRIGDPSFRSEERPILSIRNINSNVVSLRTIFNKYLNYKNEPNKALMVDNESWLTELNYLEFLRDFGKHFSINRMLSFDSVKTRLDREQSLSFLEFNYMLLQAYDFLELNRKFNCSLQIGGSDQWGNIVSGIDLIRRISNKHAFGLTSPLITTADGKKMGKSHGKAIWLNPKLLSPYEFWQFWRNTDDSDVTRFLLLYTELPYDDCIKYGALKGQQINDAKILLANQITELCHGKTASMKANTTAVKVFQHGEIDFNLPTQRISLNELKPMITISQLLIKSGLVSSGKEAKRLIAEDGARYNDKLITSPNLQLTEKDFKSPIKLSAGKKRHVLLKLETDQ